MPTTKQHSSVGTNRGVTSGVSDQTGLAFLASTRMGAAMTSTMAVVTPDEALTLLSDIGSTVPSIDLRRDRVPLPEVGEHHLGQELVEQESVWGEQQISARHSLARSFSRSVVRSSSTSVSPEETSSHTMFFGSARQSSSPVAYQSVFF